MVYSARANTGGGPLFLIPPPSIFSNRDNLLGPSAHSAAATCGYNYVAANSRKSLLVKLQYRWRTCVGLVSSTCGCLSV